MPKHNGISKILVIGSGPIVIGQAAEFDYAGTQACLSLKEEGIEVVLVNNNPATIMTDQTIADHVYIEPLTVESIEKIIEIEKPDGMIGTLGGQTGLNLTVQLFENEILQKHNVRLLGTSVASIQKGEDREQFRNLMLEIGEPTPESMIVESYEAGVQFVQEAGYPVIIRPAYTLGGAGGGFAVNDEEFEAVLKQGLRLSPIDQVLVEKSIKGWKEIEYEVMRDENDTCTIVCNMENMDPVGVHTGDSIVVAPSQTLSDVQYQILRNASLKVIRALDVVGGCNIQFAMNPTTNEYYIIEVNPRVSRSSALASKATGYPIARIATKCAIGYHLDEIINPITENTFASFEPALDYLVVKLPRFPFDKFLEADRSLGTQMKATGEVMAIDRSFEGALNKAIRSLEMKAASLSHPSITSVTRDELETFLKKPTDMRLFAISEAYKRGFTTEEVFTLTEIDRWFLTKVKKIVDCENDLVAFHWDGLPHDLLKRAKTMNISDRRLGDIFHIDEKQVRKRLKSLNLTRGYKLVDTCAGEFDAVTPYYYSTWQGSDEVETRTESGKKKILVVGSGPIRIGQGVEFDYCSVQAALAVQKIGHEAIVMNNNPETVSTDYTVADRLYFEPLSVEDILAVVEKENVDGVLVQFGGQTAINVAEALVEEGVNVLGTESKVIDEIEDRNKFYKLLDDLQIPHISGKTVYHDEDLLEAADDLGYPVLIRPSYVIGGQSMYVCHNRVELSENMKRLTSAGNAQEWPLLVDQFLPGMECELDVISDGKTIVVPGIFEHLERAGVHSGDSITIFPPVSISDEIKAKMIEYAEKIALAAPVIGMMNIQYVVNDKEVYVLEVNPRASRTVPIMSKVTGVPMVESATHVQLGKSLDVSDEHGLLPEPNYYSIKAPIFSASKLKGVDHLLGPEMKSTGETLGLGLSLQEAFSKALQVEERTLPENGNRATLFCSITDRAKKECIWMIQAFSAQGYQILATPGTADYLAINGISATKVPKDKEILHDIWKNEKPNLVLNIPTQGREHERFGFYIRELSVRYQVPFFTSIDTVKPWLDTIYIKDEPLVIPRTLNDYHELAENDVDEVRGR